ncbi:MAG TPA: hypothetical protein VK642_14325, partial [Burkholderiales bacterium]|nr:hypothetical protein [Burkholderiales bacterium]
VEPFDCGRHTPFVLSVTPVKSKDERPPRRVRHFDFAPRAQFILSFVEGLSANGFAGALVAPPGQ